MNLLKTLVTISGMTMLSRITGLVRELLIARAFGASGFTDAFFVAFRIPNLLRRLFAEGAFSQAFVPILAEYVNKKGADPARELVDKVATALMWTLVLICFLGMMAAPGVVYLIATGFDSNGDVFDLSVLMTRIMFPYILFMSLVALAGGILNTWREFRIPAFTPVLLNISFIIASLFVAPYLKQPVLALAFAVFVGGFLQLAIQIPALMKIGNVAPGFDQCCGRFSKSGCQTGYPADDSRDFCRLGSADQSDDQYQYCFASGAWQCFLDFLCRSSDGISQCFARGRFGYDFVAQFVQGTCE